MILQKVYLPLNPYEKKNYFPNSLIKKEIHHFKKGGNAICKKL